MQNEDSDGEEMHTLNPAFVQDDEVVDFGKSRFRSSKTPSPTLAKKLCNFKLYFCYCFAVLGVFVAVMVFVLVSRSAITNTLNGLVNHNYSLLVENYEPIAKEVLSAMNQSADPCNDFYNYACGGWIAATTLPAEVPRITKAFASVEEANLIVLRKIVNDQWPLVTPFFQSCNSGYQQGNFSKIQVFFDLILNASSSGELFTTLAKIRTDYGLDLSDFSFQLSIEPDLYTPSKRRPVLDQASLPLPGPSYYDTTKGLLDEQEYYRYVISLFSLSPQPIGIDEAIQIFSYESAVSQCLVTGSKAMEPAQLYRKLPWFEIGNFMPREVSGYLKSFDLLPHVDIIMSNANYFFKYNDVIVNTDLKVLKNVALYSLFRNTYPLLSAQFYDAERGLYSMLEGISHKAQTPTNRERMCLLDTANSMPSLVGHYFVEELEMDEVFKEEITTLVEILRTSFSDRIESVTWMDVMTKSSAQGKLSAMGMQIAYPDNWNEGLRFEQQIGIPFDPNNFFSNAIRLRNNNDKQGFLLLNSTIDPTEWTEPLTIVNAFYNPESNRITIPAGILRPPFVFSSSWRKAPFSLIWGTIGAVLGHEETHGFDNTGRKFAADGALSNWWTQTSDNGFAVASECLSTFYDGLETQVEGVYVDGDQTLGENIADLGGLETALDSFFNQKDGLNAVDSVDYEDALKNVFPQLSDEQLFFIAYAQNWCEKATDDYVRELVVTDAHSPAKNRVEGVLMNMPRFAQAFACPTGSRYVPPDRCKVW